jgi:pimeloyl-ACP methyl ester carboxylesterase
MSSGKLMLSVVLIAALSGLATAATPPGIPDGWTDGYVYANGIRIHYYHATPAPSKPVIVMAHGVTDIGLCWTTLTRELEASYDVYMVDARGHGLTDPSTAEDTRDTSVEDLVDFIRVMKFEKPILMGHSMGSGTVMRLAAQHKDLARAAILLDPGLRMRGPAAAVRPPAETTRREPTPGALVMGGEPAALVAQNNRSYDGLVAQCREQTPLWDRLDCEYWAVSKRQYHGNYHARSGRPRGVGGRTSTAETLAQITVPTLILKADAPPETRKTNEEVAKALKNGKLVHIDGSGHNLHHDQRQRTMEALRPFLNSL